nr:DUF2391 family protein [Alteripontixanthobacter muriae]
MDRDRLLLFLVFTLILLFPLSYFVGFERTGGWFEDLLDAIVALGVGAITSAAMLAVFGITTTAMPAGEIIGKIAVQTVPASIGAIVARGQLGSQDTGTGVRQKQAGYPGQLFIMLAGAVFLAFNVAPTEEMVLIAFKMTPTHAIALILLSIFALHAFVYALGFRGRRRCRKAWTCIGWSLAAASPATASRLSSASMYSGLLAARTRHCFSR